jgi:hypothetical protein
MMLGSAQPTFRPTFTLTVGRLRSETSHATAGPRALVVERDMDIPADALRLHLAERSGVALDDPVTVELGYEGAHERVFTGRVVALRPAIAGVVVDALGAMNALLNLRAAATFEGQAAGSIAGALIGQAGLERGTIDAGPVLPRYAVDRRLNAFAHVKDLADRLGYELYADRFGRIMFRALGAAVRLDARSGGMLRSAAGVIAAGAGGGQRYRFGEHVIDAAASRQSAPWSAIAVGGESPMSRQGDTTAHWLTTADADGHGAAGAGASALLVLDPAARTRDLADRFAAGYLATSERQAHQVAVRVAGNAGLELGDPLAISNVPDPQVNGTGYVRAIRHRFGEATGFVTEVSVCLDALL